MANLQQEAINNAGNQYVSSQTQAIKQNLDANYGGSNPYGTFKTSQKTDNAYNYWQNVQAAQPDPYESRWMGTIDDLLGQIVNREDFSYDFNADPLYQQYKDQYTKQGKNAMKDTVAQVSNMTGGYGNSYATTAGSQAYQNYLEQLNNKIPELYQMAMNKYKMDTDTLMGKYNAVGSQEDREYGQWSTNYGLWQNDRDYALRAYGMMFDQDMSSLTFNSNNWKDDRTYNYNMWRDSVGDDHWAYNSAYNAAKDAQDYDYQLSRDAFNDALTMAQWNFEQQKYYDSQARRGSSRGGRTSSSTKDEDNAKLKNSNQVKFVSDEGDQIVDNIFTNYHNSYNRGANPEQGLDQALDYIDSEVRHGRMSTAEGMQILSDISGYSIDEIKEMLGIE